MDPISTCPMIWCISCPIPPYHFLIIMPLINLIIYFITSRVYHICHLPPLCIWPSGDDLIDLGFKGLIHLAIVTYLFFLMWILILKTKFLAMDVDTAKHQATEVSCCGVCWWKNWEFWCYNLCNRLQKQCTILAKGIACIFFLVFPLFLYFKRMQKWEKSLKFELSLRRAICLQRKMGYLVGHFQMVGKATAGYMQWGSLSAASLERRWTRDGSQMTLNAVGKPMQTSYHKTTKMILFDQLGVERGFDWRIRGLLEGFDGTMH